MSSFPKAPSAIKQVTMHRNTAADLNRNIEVDNKAITNYRDLLVNLLFLRRLPPWHANVGKRLAKMEKGQC